jgi:hypothetical protein
MEAEDIILKKEWTELNAAEKDMLSGLADDEASFNLLKKMLLVAAEEPVPVISDTVQRNLIDAFQRPAPVVRLKKWYYAAAAIVVIVVTISLWQRPGKKIDAGIVDVPGKQDTAQQITRLPDTVYMPSSVKQIPDEVAEVKPKKGHPKKQTRQKPVVDDVAVNASVKENPGLLVFITEVY